MILGNYIYVDNYKLIFNFVFFYLDDKFYIKIVFLLDIRFNVVGVLLCVWVFIEELEIFVVM